LIEKWSISRRIFSLNFFILSFEFIYCHTLIFKAKSLNSSIQRWKLFEMKINIMILKKKYVVHWRKKFEIQEVMLIYFELRTFFDLKNRKTSTVKRCFRYLNKTVKIKFELRISLYLCLFEKKYDLEIVETLLYLWKRTESRNLSRCYCIFWRINC
jgi:hypothetical protein